MVVDPKQELEMLVVLSQDMLLAVVRVEMLLMFIERRE